MRRLLKRRPSGLIPSPVWLPADLLNAMAEEATEKWPLETGGVLLGYIGIDSGTVVTHVVGPGSHARHLSDRFEPDAEFHEQEIARFYNASGRISTYLGDWHSHPKGGGKPSERDRKTAKKIARTGSARAPFPLMLILRPDGGRWIPRVHRWCGSDLVEIPGRVS